MRKSGSTLKNRSDIRRLWHGLTVITALSGASLARADLPEPGPASFDPSYFRGNLFHWVDFDPIDMQESWPNPDDPDTPASGLTPYAGAMATYDDNLYRLPAAQLVPSTGAIATREDVIKTVTAGIDGHLSASRDGVELLARADYNRFAHNHNLDNTSTSAAALGHWVFGSRVSGQLGATYDRKLTQFGNYYVLTPNFVLPKDIDTAYTYSGALHVALAARLRVSAEALQVNTSHTSNTLDKYRGDTGTLTLEYSTFTGTSVALRYQATNGHYDFPGFVDGVPFDRNFQEHTPTVQILTSLGSSIWVRAEAGYVDHKYPGAAHYDFSGAIWDASLAWQASPKTQLLLTGSRRVYAYIDAQSQYFVSQAACAIARWAPTAQLSMELQFSRENQHFIGPNPAPSVLLPQHNVIHSGQFNLAWSLSRSLQTVVSYRRVTRDSNVPVFALNDDFITASLQARF